MKLRGKIACVLAPLTVAAMSIPGAAMQAHGTALKGDVRDLTAVSRTTSYFDATVTGSWQAPTYMEMGRLVGVMRDDRCLPVFQLDAELNRYIFAGQRAVEHDPARPIGSMEAGGILGTATPLKAAGLELQAVGQWQRHGDGMGRFRLTLFLGMEQGVVPPLAVGAMEGDFMPDEEPGAPGPPGPLRTQLDRHDFPRHGGDCYRSPKSDDPDASDAPRDGGSLPATVSGAGRGPHARGADGVLGHLHSGTFAGIWEVHE